MELLWITVCLYCILSTSIANAEELLDNYNNYLSPDRVPKTRYTSEHDDNHKPRFDKCESYKPTVKEEEKDVTLITVHATDDDPLNNGGTVSYKIIQKEGERVYFSINNETGEIKTVNTFDRDEPLRQKEVYLSVQATDNGRPSLADICTFKVTVLDINDNAPSFDQQAYSTQVSEDLKPNSEVMRVFAFDFDDGENSRLTYSFLKNDTIFREYFKIDPATGVIYLTQSINNKLGNKFQEIVRVKDNGEVSLENTADISIIVVGSEKQPPSISAEKKNIVLKENYNYYDADRPLVEIQAQSNIKDESVVFELMKGKTTQTNKDQTFLLIQTDNTAKIILARPLDYETVVEYTLTVTVRNKDMLSASLTIKVEIEDVNDEIPTFIELLKGSVLENDQAGAVAMQVRAIDKDGTSANNIVSYELRSHSEFFAINRETGVITAKTTFDREEESVYHLLVKAYDNSPSAIYANKLEPNSVIQAFQISIEDKNDNPPYFEPKVYVVHNISEIADQGSNVVEVQAHDKDTASLINYSIIDGNIGDAFFIETTTGRIKVKNKLDFEKIENYNLTVLANDGIFNDTAEVYVYILNENDEPPVFEDYKKDIVIEEEKRIETCVVTLKAYDPDIKDRNADQRITYEVQNNFSHVDQNGCVTIIKELDRDAPNGSPKVQSFVIAYDGFGPTPLKTFAEITFHLSDINDNAPFLNVTEVVWYENQAPGLIMELTADDYDSVENGPPFHFSMADNATQDMRNKFSVEDNRIIALVTFDREEQRYYDVPITISDSGTPIQTGTSILRVIIGDVNDNEAKSGSSDITVYKYEELDTDIKIGRVYVDDPDDWDLLDKVFQFKSQSSDFDLDNVDRGMIIMKRSTQNGTYRLEFTVTEEHAPNIPKHTVDASVVITVNVIPTEAVVKSGSVRVNETTIDQMVEKNSQGFSKLDILQQQLAKYFNISVKNVDVFTVLPANGSFIDVRFSAHGSPYYESERLNYKVTEFQTELERNLGVHIHMIGINECLNEDVCHGSCENELIISKEPATVFTNKTSFVGIKAFVQPVCQCERKKSNGCNDGQILDGGVCGCAEGFDGPNCEILAIGFTGSSWAVYPGFDACERIVISLSIVPQQNDGLIFYVGPSNLQQARISKDFLSLELREGVVVLKLDFGHGPLEMEKSIDKTDDKPEHEIVIKIESKEVQLMVGSCGSNCLSWNSLPGKMGLLNANGPLQLGSLRHSFTDDEFRLISDQSAPSARGFDGCVKNFRYNDYLYNLGVPSDSYSVHPNCRYGIARAVTFGIKTNFLVAILVCVAILIILLLAVVVHKRKHDNFNEKDIDDTRATIINYEDEGGGECDASFDLSVLRPNLSEKPPIKDNLQTEVPAALTAFLHTKKDTCDKDPDNLPFDDVRHYAYEGDGNSTASSLSSLASCTDEGDLKFNYLSNFGPRFRKLADMYGNDNSDEDSQEGGEESWC